jgi:hypothetical protein
MRETLSAEQYQALHGSGKKSNAAIAKEVEGGTLVAPETKLATRIRQHLRAMGNYYEVPETRTETYIKDCLPEGLDIADHLWVFAQAAGIPELSASFYIRQQLASNRI